MLNIENMKAVKAWLQTPSVKPDLAFNMSNFAIPNEGGDGEDFCGTSCCIAGFAVLALGRPEVKSVAYEYLEIVGKYTDPYMVDEDIPSVYWEKEAAEILGLSQVQSDWLFFGHFTRGALSSITKEQAIQALDYLIENPDETFETDDRRFRKPVYFD